MAKTKGELSLWNKIAFGMGDIYGGGSMIIVGIYYLYFLTDVVGLSPALAGTVLLISKIWDAVNDPLMGVITDRTRTRYGRRRPFLLAGIAFIFLSYFMLWYPVSYQSEVARFEKVFITAFVGFVLRETAPEFVVIERDDFFVRFSVNHGSERAVSDGKSLCPGRCRLAVF